VGYLIAPVQVSRPLTRSRACPTPRRSPYDCICLATLLHRAVGDGVLRMQPVVHYGFIPALIFLGMTQTEPRPSLAQLLSPV